MRPLVFPVVTVLLLAAPSRASAQMTPGAACACRGDHTRVGTGDFQIWCHRAESNWTPIVGGTIVRPVTFTNDGSGWFADGDMCVHIKPFNLDWATNAKQNRNKNDEMEFEVSLTPPDLAEPMELDDATKAARHFVNQFVKSSFTQGMAVEAYGHWVEDSGHPPQGGSQTCVGFQSDGGKTELHPLHYMIGGRSREEVSAREGTSLSFLVAQDSSMTLVNPEPRFSGTWRNPLIQSFKIPLDFRTTRHAIPGAQVFEAASPEWKTTRDVGVLAENAILDFATQVSKAAFLSGSFPDRNAYIGVRLGSPAPVVGIRSFYVAKLEKSAAQMLQETIRLVGGTCEQFGLSGTGKALKIEFLYSLAAPNLTPVAFDWAMTKQGIPLGATLYSHQLTPGGYGDSYGDDSSSGGSTTTPAPDPFERFQTAGPTFVRFFAPRCSQPNRRWQFGVVARNYSPSSSPPNGMSQKTGTRRMVSREVVYELSGTSVSLAVHDPDVGAPAGIRMCGSKTITVTASSKPLYSATIESHSWEVSDGTAANEATLAPGESKIVGWFKATAVAGSGPSDVGVLTVTREGVSAPPPLDDDGFGGVVRVTATVQSDLGEVAEASTAVGRGCETEDRDRMLAFWVKAETIATWMWNNNVLPRTSIPQTQHVQSLPSNLSLRQRKTRGLGEPYKFFRGIPRELVPLARDFITAYAGRPLAKASRKRLNDFLAIADTKRVQWVK